MVHMLDMKIRLQTAVLPYGVENFGSYLMSITISPGPSQFSLPCRPFLARV
jgi:hypothetical protein